MTNNCVNPYQSIIVMEKTGENALLKTNFNIGHKNMSLRLKRENFWVLTGTGVY